MLTMRDRKEIISEYDRTGSIRAVARNLGLNRKTVRRYVEEYLAARASSDAEYTVYLKNEPEYKKGSRRPRKVLTEAVCSMIESMLRENEDKKMRGDRKLCMKATDIHERLLKAGYRISYPTVTKYILGRRKVTESSAECFIRQVYTAGQDCEFDWGELHLTIDGRRIKLYMAVFTLAYSNGRMAFLFLHQDTASFLEAHRRCFDIFTAVPHRMVYDNMRVAVAAFTMDGKLPTDALLRLERAYGFSHRFCNIRAGNEKGHVERSVEIVRRKAFSSRDSFDSIEEANQYLYDYCSQMNKTARSVATADIVTRMRQDLDAMLPLVDSVSAFEPRQLTVDKYGTVVLGGIHYSVPDTLVGKRLNIHEYANYIEIFNGRQRVSTHEKTPVYGWKLDIMHYINTFERKPGSVAGSAALQYAAPGIRDVYADHFSGRPSEFISLLKRIREENLTLEDFICAHDMLEQAGVNPSSPGAFEQMLFPSSGLPDVTRPQSATAHDIEQFAMMGLQTLTEIMN